MIASRAIQHATVRLQPVKVADIALIAQSACFVLGIFVYLTGLWIESYYVQFSGVFLVFLSNIVYAALRLQTRIMLLFLNFGMFLFWLSRPFFGITYLHNEMWMYNTAPSVTFSLMAIMMALFFTRLGNDCYEWLTRQPAKRESTARGKTSPIYKAADHAIPAIRHASLLVYVILFVGGLVYGFQMLSYARSVSYEALHLVSASTYTSTLFSSMHSMAPYALCVFLATMPSKRPATVALLLNIVMAVPSLLTGARSAFVLAIVFLAFYYLLRACVRHESGWITRFEIMIVVIGLPLGIFAMGMMNYFRGGRDIAPESIIGTLCDAFYKQGVTFSILQYAFNTNSELQQLGFKFYTMGLLTDTITQGFIGQLFLGTELLPDYNSIDLAVKGTLYAHTMGFFTHWNYLGGEAYGTSFVLEAFADFGYIGIVVVSFIMGFLMAFLSCRAEKGVFSLTVVELLAATKVFFLPRGEAVGWLSFLWSTRFWLTITVIALLALFLYSRYRKAKLIPKLA